MPWHACLIPSAVRTALFGLIVAAGSVSACAPTERTASPNLPHASPAPPPEPYADVNTVAQDRAVWQQLLSDHARIRRTVIHRQEGDLGIIEATTESDDPAVAARIVNHAKAMQARMKAGATVRAWDPVFKELFARHEQATLDVTPTDKGVKIVESSRDPETIALLRSHAMGVSEFVRFGHEAGGRATPRLPVGAPLPPPEVAVGGVPHRFLLSQPDAAQVAALGQRGVGRIVNFRKPGEPGVYDEHAAAQANNVAYCAIPFKDAEELTDAVLDAAREQYRAADRSGDALALHCRTGNRVGPGWAAYLALDKGASIEDAIAGARGVGMVDPLYESITREYVRRRRATPANEASVQWVGGMHAAVHDGAREGKVSIGTLRSRPGLIAIGPVAGLRGEITVIDGVSLVATVGEHGPVSVERSDVDAAFLAWAHVPAWKRTAIPSSVINFADLERHVPAAIAAAGLDVNRPWPVRIEGRAASARLHVIWHEPGDALGKEAHDRAKVPLLLGEGPLWLAGFWSSSHRGVFTPMYTDLHLHARDAAGEHSGHVDDVQLMPGAELLLPDRSAASGDAWTPVAIDSLTITQRSQNERAEEARSAMFSRLFAALGEAMARPGADGQPVGPAGAIAVCKERAPKIAQAVAREKGVMIGRTSDRLRNPGNSAPSWAALLLADAPAEPRVTAHPDGSLGVTLPIKLAASCLACHGSPEQINPAVREALASMYPTDHAMGYKEGDLRGWFWVELPSNAAK